MVSTCCYPCATAQLYTEYKAGSYQERKHQKVLNQRMEDMLTNQQRAASPVVMCVTSPTASPVPQQMAMAEASSQAVPMAYASKDMYAVQAPPAKAAY